MLPSCLRGKGHASSKFFFIPLWWLLETFYLKRTIIQHSQFQHFRDIQPRWQSSYHKKRALFLWVDGISLNLWGWERNYVSNIFKLWLKDVNLCLVHVCKIFKAFHRIFLKECQVCCKHHLFPTFAFCCHYSWNLST